MLLNYFYIGDEEVRELRMVNQEWFNAWRNGRSSLTKNDLYELIAKMECVLHGRDVIGIDDIPLNVLNEIFNYDSETSLSRNCRAKVVDFMNLYNNFKKILLNFDSKQRLKVQTTR